MIAIILAAGIGKRLGDAAAEQPKSLLKFDNRSLLVRHLGVLQDVVERVFVVTGYKHTAVQHELEQYDAKIAVATVLNREFDQGSVVSLWRCCDILRAADDVLIMDADVLYHPQVLLTLVNSDKPNCFLLDRNYEPGDEPVKICVCNDRIVEFRKQIPATTRCDLRGESVGFFRFSSAMAISLADRLQTYIEQKQTAAPYEDVIRDLVLVNPEQFGFEDITGLPWIEIDFVQDLNRARNEIIREIHRLCK